ncbi:DUF7115 domain-containing protein [Halopiger xanaduensis]|uniref:DUF7115 domain-containing protein n=1 Tax=Halopiger xanaduensis (strain DSM 18323 / JCM 14033 / SH-6) TaxID=797210 RepID=F8D9V2_HALXS|nr:hypothetical protein [Halopiger xanaduensis]AEH35729.1 hypothetical protein Halxa_1095 [Halopiger xanaduensis SH-6]
MSVPGIVQSTLGDEEIAARVSLGSEDELFITSSSTLVYRSDGLLRDESVDEYPHEADRLTLSEGRRKTKFSLEYPLEGTKEFTVPSGKTDAVLHPVLAGVLNGNGITEPGETVAKTYRFSELTLIVTSERLVKHIGSAVWDEDYEEYHYEDVTNLSFEDGSVATQIVLEVDGRPQRIKAPNEEANDLRERLQRALFDYHDVGSLEELNEAIGLDDADDDRGDSGGTMEFGSGVDPLNADPPELDDQEGARTATADAGATETTVDAAADANASSETNARADADATGSGVSDSIDGQSNRRDDTSGSAAESTTETGGSSDAADGDTDPFVEATESISDDTTSDATATQRRQGQSADTTDIDASGDSAAQSWPSDDPAAEAAAGDSVSTATDPEVLERLEALEAAVERQSDVIEQQQRTIEQLIEELRQGR